MSFAGKRILITGGLGFIGSNLAIKLVGEGASVTVLDALIPGMGGNVFNIEPVKQEVRVVKADLRNRAVLNRLVLKQDYIFHLAAQAGHRYSMQKPLDDMSLNAEASLHLVEACRRYNPGAVIVFTSTRQFYGPPQYLPVDEKHPIHPPDINGIHKFAAEQYHTLYSAVYGLRTASLRLTNVYGPRQLIRSAQQGFIGWFVNRAIQGERIQLFGGGQQVRDFNYVDDVTEALTAAALSPECLNGGIYNLSGECADLEKVARMLARLVGGVEIEAIPFPASHKPIDIGSFYADSALFHEHTGWTPKIGLEEGLAMTIDYYRKHKKTYLM